MDSNLKKQDMCSTVEVILTRCCYFHSSINTQSVKAKGTNFPMTHSMKKPQFESKQYLDIRKLKSSFKKLGINMSSSRLKKFFRKYNTSNDGKLSLHQFLDIFIPKNLSRWRHQLKSDIYRSKVFQASKRNPRSEGEGVLSD